MASLKRMQEQREIVKATSVMGSATFASRILGLIRDIVIAAFFGATATTDAFFLALTIPNLLRRLLGEGTLTTSFVPVYTEYLTRRPEEAPRVVHITTTVISTLLFVLTILGIVLSPFIIKLQAPWWNDPEQIKLTVLLTRICFPYLFFIGLMALAMGILNSHRHFLAPAAAPCLLNISIIACVIFLSPRIYPPIVTAALGFALGGLAQLLLQIPFLRAKGITFKVNFDLHHPAVRRIALMMAPMMLGIGAYQFNFVISRLLATKLPAGSVSYLFYAFRFFEFPQGIFTVALGVAVLPSFARLVSQKRMEEFVEGVNFSLRMMLFITIPAMVGLTILRVPILNLILQRGDFTYHTTLMTAQALLYYSLSLWAYGGIQVLSRAFYALDEVKIPVTMAIGALMINLLLGFILMGPLLHAGLALAMSIAAIVNISLLAFFFHRKTSGIRVRELIVSVSKTAVAATPVALVGIIIERGYTWTESGGYVAKIPLLGGGIIVAMALFFFCSYLLRNRELHLLWDFIRSGRDRKRPFSTPQV
ncbi:MAG: murein biosynthesis integral membrane protein MurJ [Deltaproteobacteria bacterium]|nr:murein biosynthesis integral membrane protein MurJ [Deltaproteobacteria bacterium]